MLTDARNYIIDYIRRQVAENNQLGLFRQPLVGFSSPQDELYRQIKQLAGEQHVLPEEILPTVKTIVSFFIPISAQVVESNRGQQVSEIYLLSYIHANQLINDISSQLAEQFRAQGVAADTVPSTYNFSQETLKANWSHRSAAYIAGLGSFGLNNLLITEKGCAGRFGSIFLGLEIEADPRPDIERCIYYRQGSCRYCQTHCPAQALSEVEFDRFGCNRELQQTASRFPQYSTSDVCGKCLVGPCAIFKE
jgi:epoxyqueuosine reductase QueG